MTKKQIRLLKLAYKHPITVDMIYKKLRIDYDELQNLTADIQEYYDFSRNSNYEKSVFSLSHNGAAFVELYNCKQLEKVRGWITTAIAILAFILSVISLLWQVDTWKAEKSELTQLPVGAVTTTGKGVPSSSHISDPKFCL